MEIRRVVLKRMVFFIRVVCVVMGDNGEFVGYNKIIRIRLKI